MPVFDVSEIVQALHQVRDEWRDAQNRSREPQGREFPSRDAMAQVVQRLQSVLFPMRLGPPDLRHDSEDAYVGDTLDAALQTLLVQARLELAYGARRAPRDAADRVPAVVAPADIECVERAALGAVRTFADSLPGIRRLLDSDVMAAFQGDPAARSVDEVLLCYPGVHAMIHHRLAHRLYRLGLPLLARIVSELAHGQTGIDIHPGATIGAGLFIDHGTGVVIGETAQIGERVRIYQAVTLGAKRFPTDAEGKLQKGLPRHPRVEDEVVIYAGATILGRITLGRGATIGGNVWVTEDVPAGASVTQASLQKARVA